jgi:hypothetical protein
MFSSRAWMTVVLIGALGGLVACPQAPQVRQPVTTVVTPGNAASGSKVPVVISTGNLVGEAVGDPQGTAGQGCFKTATQLDARPDWITKGVPDYCGRSRVLFPEPTDTTIVNDDEANSMNDKSQTRLTDVTISFFVSNVINGTSNGVYAAEYAINEAIENGVLSEYAILEMSVFDVDSNLSDTELPEIKCRSGKKIGKYEAEIDKLQFNDYWLETETNKEPDSSVSNIEGENNKWTVYSKNYADKNMQTAQGFDKSKKNIIWKAPIRIPTRWIRFPSTPGKKIENKLTIKVDKSKVNRKSHCPGDDNSGTQLVWSLEVDWAALSFGMSAPPFFVHGINTDQGEQAIQTFGSMKSEFEKGHLVPAWPPIQLPQENLETVTQNQYDCSDISTWQTRLFHAILIKKSLGEPRFTNLGSARVRLFGHSKGGLDSITLLSKLAYIDTFGKLRLREKISFRSMGVSSGGSAGTLKRDIEVISYTSVNSPHGGSALSDLAMNVRNGLAVDPNQWWQLFGVPISQGAALLLNVAAGDFQCELTTDRAFQDSASLDKKKIMVVPSTLISSILNLSQTVPAAAEGSTPAWKLVGAPITVTTTRGVFPNLGDIEVTQAGPRGGISKQRYNSNETVVARWSHSALKSLYPEQFKLFIGVPNAGHTGSLKDGIIPNAVASEFFSRSASIDNWRVKP